MLIFDPRVLAPAVLCIALASPASAQVDPPPKARIVVSDLDLATGAGQALLGHRIGWAAHAACDRTNPAFSPGVRRSQQDCRRDMTLAARAAVRARPAIASARAEGGPHGSPAPRITGGPVQPSR